MQAIQSTCEPRADLLAGTFNAEVFTASLAQVLGRYRKTVEVDTVYTRAETFFGEATYPTDGLRTTLREVFGRIAGDNAVPAIHRLETAFGGGKTHTLIACTHIAYQGTQLRGVVESVLAPELLPSPGEVAVVGVAGDRLPVHAPKGPQLVPHTLWGEIAHQVGGDALYQALGTEATSPAAPGAAYFDTVFRGRKALIMLDELAQYAARLDAARPGGAAQLAAFLMALHGYARDHAHVAVVLSLASAADAFARQTAELARLLTEVRGSEVSQDEALRTGDRAVSDLRSVVARDATAVTPVQAAEICSVLAKRLFARIDRQAADACADEYMAMYRRSAGLLPEEATRSDFRDRMASHYPFHPSLIDYLNHKLATAEEFQGTRGVLRILARAVRSLWTGQQRPPMIHCCHLDMRDAGIVNEVLGRTGSGDLATVLNADVGGVDTEQLHGGRSNAQLADLRNPHPEGHPMYEYTWKTVFLHSLVGRDRMLGSDLFGLTEQQALFQVSFPGLTPPQVAEALKEIDRSAYYLRCQDGRYYASLEPSVNIALARIRRTIGAEQVTALLDATVRKIARDDALFHVLHDVSAPEHIPDKKGRPALGVVKLDAGTISVDEFITTKGRKEARIEQNLVLLLVPDTVRVRERPQPPEDLFGTEAQRAEKTLGDLQELARFVLAMRQLRDKPQEHGINAARLAEVGFDARYSEREQALVTATTQAYTSLWYPSAGGKSTRKEIRTAGGEGGAAIFQLIREALAEDNKLLTAEHTRQSDLTALAQLFFRQGDTVSIADVGRNFCCARSWPLLESPQVLEQIVRAGVASGVWCLFRMGDADSGRPAELYSRESNGVPLTVDLARTAYSLVTAAGAKQRGWTAPERLDPARVNSWVHDAVATAARPLTYRQVRERVVEGHGEVAGDALDDAVVALVQDGRLLAYKGDPDTQEKPALVCGQTAALFVPQAEHVLLTRAEAAKRGWLAEGDRSFRLEGSKAVTTLLPLLRQIGGLYARGASSQIRYLDLAGLVLPKGGTLRLSLANVTPEGMRQLGELLEVLHGLVQAGPDSHGELEIPEPDGNCPLIKRLREDGAE